jgi:hypothetical protein
MADLRLLERTLGQTVTWNKARIKLLARLLVALLQVRTVNLAQLASALQTGALVASNYKRLQRFFAQFALPQDELALVLPQLLGVERPWVLTLDRTEWHFAKLELNVLVLAIAHRGVAIPLLWLILPKGGCTSFEQRRELVERFIALFGLSSIRYITADREFHGRRWYQYLGARGIRFCLRLRRDTPVTEVGGWTRPLHRALWAQRQGVQVTWGKPRRIWGQVVKVTSVRLRADQWLVVVGSPELGDLLEAYGVRWQIETLFGCLKSRGFDLEATHLTQPERLARLLAVLALAFAWAIAAGEWVCERRPLTIQAHKRLTKSLFRTGLDALRQVLCNFGGTNHLFTWRQAVRFLSCT